MKKGLIVAILLASVGVWIARQEDVFPTFMKIVEDVIRESPIDEYSLWEFIDTDQNFTNLGYAPLIDFPPSDPEAWQKQLYFEVFKYANNYGKKANWKNVNILELASGKGAGLNLIANHKGWNFAINKAAGVERSYPGWQYATKHYGSDRVSYHLTDARNLTFDENSFDIVYSVEANGVLFRKNFQEISRVLKPDGVFVFATLKFSKWDC